MDKEEKYQHILVGKKKKKKKKAPYMELCCKLSLLTKDPYGLKLENVRKQYHGYGCKECPYIEEITRVVI